MSETSGASMSTQNVSIKPARGVGGWFSGLVILMTIVIGELIYHLVFGAPSNFVDGNIEGHPVEEGVGKWFGLFYKGGVLVPVAIALFLMVIIFSIERFITLSMAKGRGSIDVFVQKIQLHLENDDIASATKECDRQRGTIGNVTKEVLKKYDEMKKSNVAKESKLQAIQKALEESIALELPMLEKHLVIIATIVSIATLVGLIGTVLGMIKAFAALATSGAPDAVALATGISEALVNTATGVTTSTLATVMYNYFTSQIDAITYKVDEAGYSIVQTFNERY